MSLADFQILAAIPVVSIPRPSVFLMLKVSKVFIYASQVFHSSKDSFLEFYEVSAIAVPSLGSAVGVLGLVIVPSRYSWTSLIWAIVLIVLLHRIQFNLLNLSDSLCCSGIGPNVFAIVVM